MNQHLKQWLIGEKRGEDEKKKKNEYLENENSFLDEIKSSF